MNRQATRAISTASGRLPPAKAAPDGIDAATAAAGAIAVMLWNRTSRNPIASRRSPPLGSPSMRPPDMCQSAATCRLRAFLTPRAPARS
ncbi:hypothetical protein GCM10009787_46280 [Streptomyces bangladeshensis]|uniref:Uncharacterized protein n=1 Tax=Streptomyces bangladeshensis TaxID=295352 RepID=A0ABN3BR54_9ACTN